MSETGGSFLGEAAAAVEDQEGGTPAAGARDDAAAAPGFGAEDAVRDTMDGPPEWAPRKYWDDEKRQLRVEEMAKGYQNLEKLLGREKVPVPADDDDRDGWERWFKATGRPDKPDEYQFQEPELPEDLPYDKEAETNFRTWAHLNGLNQKQANNLYDGYVKHQLERHVAWHNTQKQQRQELDHALEREYGNKLPAVKQNVGALIKANADPEFYEYLDSTGQGNDPRMLRFLYRISQRLQGETKLVGSVKPAPAPQDYEKAIADFRDKHKEALFNAEHPNHAVRVKEFNKLFEGAYGTDPFTR